MQYIYMYIYRIYITYLPYVFVKMYACMYAFAILEPPLYTLRPSAPSTQAPFLLATPMLSMAPIMDFGGRFTVWV